MKLYLAAGQYAGTQADAKAIAKDFEAVEVPTDKTGLIEYLNSLVSSGAAVPGENYSERSVMTDKLFEALPIGTQLTLAAIAADNARYALGKAGAEPQNTPEEPADTPVEADEEDPFS